MAVPWDSMDPSAHPKNEAIRLGSWMLLDAVGT